MRRTLWLGGSLLALVLPVAGRADGPAPSAPSAQPRCVIFFEGNDCDPNQARSSCCTESTEDMGRCWTNDEARSMKVYGGAGTVLTAFDAPDASTQDDYFVLRKQDDRPICVGSFEGARGHFDPPGRPKWFYSGGNGLDGKVSTFRWSDPRRPASSVSSPPTATSAVR